jgi:hypothetical protein
MTSTGGKNMESIFREGAVLSLKVIAWYYFGYAIMMAMAASIVFFFGAGFILLCIAYSL